MTKRFRYDTGCVIDQLENKVLSERQAVNHLNALHEENTHLKQRIEDYNKALKTLQDVYERKDRQLQRAKKDTRKYTDYFMNELNWDCDRIIEEVFR